MSDDLRDRIAKALYNDDYSDEPTEAKLSAAHPGYYEYAQAVIDDLGLSVEERVVPVGPHGAGSALEPRETWEEYQQRIRPRHHYRGHRVVGRWEYDK